MRYVPRHLPNKLEYKVLSCISVHYQSRMASNGIAITPPYPLTVQAGQWYYSRLIGCVRCMYGGRVQLYVAASWWGCVVGDNTGLEFREVASKVCLRETWTVSETILNTS